MTTNRSGGRIIFECDTCNETFEGERGEEFETVWSSAKREGWKTKKIGRDWVHGCPKHSA